MNVKKAMPLIAAVVLGLVAMVMARKVLKPAPPRQAPSNTSPVVVATRDVAPGRTLVPEDLVVADIPTGLVPARAFRQPADLVNRVVTTPLVKGQAVLDSLLAPEGAGAGIAALVPAGYRAMTLNIDDITGVAGMLVPGCRVDIQVIVPDERTRQQTARTVLQNLKIVAVGRQLTAGIDGAPAGPTSNVTFLVTPDEARLLQLAASTARPWLVLRSYKDGTPVSDDRTLLAELHGLPRGVAVAENDAAGKASTRPAEEAATQPAKELNFTVVEVIRGDRASQVTLPMPASMGGHGLPHRTSPAAPENSTEADKSSRNDKAAVLHPGEPAQSARPTAASDMNDAFHNVPQ